MGQTSSTNKLPELPEYNDVFKSKKEPTEESIYHDICKHYNLGDKFNRLEKYFSNLTFDDIRSSNCYYIDFVELAEHKDKIIMKIFYKKYINEYENYMINLNKK
jgi:hypothetical protein